MCCYSSLLGSGRGFAENFEVANLELEESFEETPLAPPSRSVGVAGRGLSGVSGTRRCLARRGCQSDVSLPYWSEAA